jgi:NTP pyrophosphatase (non-canonical NTP hydrolase)
MAKNKKVTIPDIRRIKRMRNAELKKYTDKRLMDAGRLFNMVIKESAYQIAKWGIQKRTAFEWLAYLTEETGELSEAVSEHHYRDGKCEQVIHEAIHVATLALKIAEMYGEDDGKR